MTHTYKSETLTKQPDGRWIVTMRNGVMTQHPTLEDAIEFIDMMQAGQMSNLQKMQVAWRPARISKSPAD